MKSDFSLCHCEECSLNQGIVLEEQDLLKRYPGRVPMYEPSFAQPNVMYVGQAPGKTEVITRMPFTGDAGKMLYALNKGAMIDQRSVYLTNVAACRPPQDAKGNDKEPSPSNILYCYERLKREIQEVKPSLIVAVGGCAAYALTGKDGIQSIRGKFFPLLDRYGYECQVLCVLHPSFVMRQRQWIEIAIKDLKLIHEYTLNGVPKLEQYTFLLDPSYTELKEYLYSAKDIVAFDTETTGLNTRKDSVIGASFSKGPYEACAVYFKPIDPRIDLIVGWLRDERFKKCTQNGSFDCEILFNNLGCVVRGLVFDTRLAEQLLQSDLPTSLDHLRATYTNIDPYKPGKKEMKNITMWGKERMLQYAAWDAVTTQQVMLKQQQLLTPQQNDLLLNHLIPLIFVINKMERKGLKVDIDCLAGMYRQKLPELDQALDKVQDRLHISATSPIQVANYFGLKDAKRETLEYHIQRGDPGAEEMELILKARGLNKICGTYLKGVYDKLEDGYAHTHFALDGTGTGRLSSSDPALQNTPKPLRIIYIPDSPDYVILSGDFRQLELWTGAILAPDEILLADLKAGLDVHGIVSELIRPYLNERLLKQLRLTAKTIVFGTFYGRSARSIAIAFGVSTNEAEHWQELCFGKYPGLKKYIQDRLSDFETSRMVSTPWGRVRHVISPTQAFNTPVQSTASDITLSTMIELDKAGFDLRVNVHDEIVMQVRRDELQEKYKQAKQIFERPIEILGGNQFPAEFKYGDNWYEMTKLD